MDLQSVRNGAQCAFQSIRKMCTDCMLVGRSHICFFWRIDLPEVAQRVLERSFESRKTKIHSRIFVQWPRKCDSHRVSFFCAAFDFRTAGVGETEHACPFIKRFSRCVIARSSEERGVRMALSVPEFGVPAGSG